MLTARGSRAVVVSLLTFAAAWLLLAVLTCLAGCDQYQVRPSADFEYDDASVDAADGSPRDAEAGAVDGGPSDAGPDGDAGDVDAATVDGGPSTFTVSGTVSGLAGSGLVLENEGGDALAVNAAGAFTFPTRIASGAMYAVTVLTQPTGPAQTCTVGAGAGVVAASDVTTVAVTCKTDSHLVGGTINALTGTGLVLENNGADDFAVVQNGAFVFATPVLAGSPFLVSVAAQPTGPSQTCTVSGGSGTVGKADVSSVVINCDASTFVLAGTVSGLAGTLVLQDNGSNDLTLTSNGSFAFSSPLPRGSTYDVTVATLPSSPAQTCAVLAGRGSGTTDVSSVVVTCSTSSFPVGGTVSGLTGGVLVLQDNGGDEVTVTASGAFTFAVPVASGGVYSVATALQPFSPSQTCTVTSASGAVGNGPVTGVLVQCAPDTFSLGGTLVGLLPNDPVTLRNSDGQTVTGSSNGPFSFALPLASGSPFTVSVLTQPGSPAQTCTVSGGSGTIGNGNASSVVVDCTTNGFTIGGQVSGLAGSVLLTNSADGTSVTVTGNGAFAFPESVVSGSAYAVVVSLQPSGPTQTCTVANGSGTVGTSSVTGISVTCGTSQYQVGGNVYGVPAGASVVLSNSSDGDTQTVIGGGPFTFGKLVKSGAAYSVTVTTAPSSPAETCQVTSGSGVVGSSAVTNIAVFCQPVSFAVGGTVSGLAGLGLELYDSIGEVLTIGANGSFRFPTGIASGSTFQVTVRTQPSQPPQTCLVNGGSGTVGSADVTSVAVNCASNLYPIGGTLTGSQGQSVVLQAVTSAGTANVTLTADGPYAFSTPYPVGTQYQVSVAAPAQGATLSCTVLNTSGTVDPYGDSDNVFVQCYPAGYTLTVSVAGLTGNGLALVDPSGGSLQPTANGLYTFPYRVPAGATYAVTVSQQPTGYNGVCTVAGGSGVMPAANVSTVVVTCAHDATSCAALHTAFPSVATGSYTIDPDGDGSIAPFPVQCDMDFQGGGWTLFFSTQPPDSPADMSPGNVISGSGTFLPIDELEALAGAATQVHLRTPGDEAHRSITSVAGTLPIQNLQQGSILNLGADQLGVNDQLASWTGPYADAAHLQTSCSVSSSSTYPSMYWACGNQSGTHISALSALAEWEFNTSNEALDFYLR